jgi:hypothetical protein
MISPESQAANTDPSVLVAIFQTGVAFLLKRTLHRLSFSFGLFRVWKSGEISLNF